MHLYSSAPCQCSHYEMSNTDHYESIGVPLFILTLPQERGFAPSSPRRCWLLPPPSGGRQGGGMLRCWRQPAVPTGHAVFPTPHPPPQRGCLRGKAPVKNLL